MAAACSHLGCRQVAPGENVRSLLRVVGTVLMLGGGIWFLQGINVLPGSFMTGQIRWAVYGGLAMIAGIGLWLVAARGKQGGSK